MKAQPWEKPHREIIPDVGTLYQSGSGSNPSWFPDYHSFSKSLAVFFLDVTCIFECYLQKTTQSCENFWAGLWYQVKNSAVIVHSIALLPLPCFPSLSENFTQ